MLVMPGHSKTLWGFSRISNGLESTLHSMKLIHLLIFLPMAALGQRKDTVTITPGQKFLVTDKLSDYKASYELFSLRDGTEKKVGELEDSFQVISEKGDKQGLRICKITFGSNIILDSGLCLLTGLKPVYHRSRQTVKRMVMDFNDNRIGGEVIYHTNRGDSSVSINHVSNVVLFDSYYEDMIARTMRFEKGILFKFGEYIYERGGLVRCTGEVVEKTKVTVRPGVMVDAWKILFFEHDPQGAIIRTTTFLVSEQSREIVLREYKTKNGIMTMRPRDSRG